jgi:hypothetical protein
MNAYQIEAAAEHHFDRVLADIFAMEEAARILTDDKLDGLYAAVNRGDELALRPVMDRFADALYGPKFTALLDALDDQMEMGRIVQGIVQEVLVEEAAYQAEKEVSKQASERATDADPV